MLCIDARWAWPANWTLMNFNLAMSVLWYNGVLNAHTRSLC
jgi:hypothetical protein